MRLAFALTLVLLGTDPAMVGISEIREFGTPRIISRPSAGDQLVSATNGTTWLVLRQNEYGIHYNITDAKGHALRPFGFFFSTASPPRVSVTIAGGDFILAWKEREVVHFLRVGNEGEVISRKTIQFDETLHEAHLDGNGEVIVLSVRSSDTKLLFLDQQLIEKKRRSFAIAGGGFEVAVSRTQVLFIGGYGRADLFRMNLAGEDLDRDPIDLGWGYRDFEAGSDGTNFLIASTAGESILLSPSGIVSAPQPLPAREGGGGYGQMVWSGTHYLLPRWYYETRTGAPVFLLTWDGAGKLIDDTPPEIAFLGNKVPGTALAFAAGAGIIFISGAGDYASQLLAYPMNDDGQFRLADAQVVFRSAAPQYTPMAASNGSAALVAWMEHDEIRQRIFFSVVTDGIASEARPLVESETDYEQLLGVTQNSAGFLITYFEIRDYTRHDMMARVTPEGELLRQRNELPSHLKATAASREMTLAVSASGGILIGTRYDRNLLPLESSPFVIATVDGFISSVAAASDGLDFQLTWTVHDNNSVDSIYTQRVSAAGVSSPRLLLASRTIPLPQIVYGDGEYLLTYPTSDQKNLVGRAITRAGVVGPEALFRLPSWGASYRLGFDGKQFVAVVPASVTSGGVGLYWVPLTSSHPQAILLTYSEQYAALDRWTGFAADGAYYIVVSKVSTKVESLGLRRLFYTRVELSAGSRRRTVHR